MILLDAQGLIALLADEPAAPAVAGLLETAGAAMTAINLAEAVDISVRVMGVDRLTVRRGIDMLRESKLHVLSCSDDDAWAAGELRAARYRRHRTQISIGDAFLLAAANPGDSIASADAAVLHVARDVGLGVIPLADSTGRLPE
jgi:uncharacterized protein with PIN domain